MRVGKINYKSLNFTLLEEKLLDDTKTQTYRTNFIPKYKIGEIIAIAFKKKFLYLAKVKGLYPKKIKDFTELEAKRDGFDSIAEFQDLIMELNKIKSKDQWGFITQFKRIPNIFDYLNREIGGSRG